MARPRNPRVDIGPETSILEHPDLWEGVASALRQAIVSGGIAAGAHLVEGDLAQRFGVSRGPIRDAFRELSREGLVVNLPRRGTVVSSPTIADVWEVYEVREALEIGAARIVIERATDEELAALTDRVAAVDESWAAPVDFATRSAVDLAFHRALINLSGNGRLASAYEQMLSQTQLLLQSASLVNPNLKRGIPPSVHQAILKAILNRDKTAADRALRQHYASSAQRLFAGARRARGAP
jgi:GntR family transcriptional regulator of gluconate operon